MKQRLLFTKVEMVIWDANVTALAQKQKVQDEKSYLMRSEKTSLPIPRREHSVQVKIVRHLHATRRRKRNPEGLLLFLVPGSTVGKPSSTASVIKEPNRVRNSEIAKFGNKPEPEKDLAKNVERRPAKISEKFLEQKIQNHWKG